MKNLILSLLFSLTASFASFSIADYSKHPEVGSFIERMVNEHNFDRQQVKNWMAQARYQKSIVDAMSRPAEKVKTWYDYRKIFITDLRIERGIEFWQANRQTLNDVATDRLAVSNRVTVTPLNTCAELVHRHCVFYSRVVTTDNI